MSSCPIVLSYIANTTNTGSVLPFSLLSVAFFILNGQGAFSPSEFSPTEGRTILQGVEAFLDGSLEIGKGDGGEKYPDDKDLPTVKVVFKKGIHVDGSNEEDWDDTLSEVRTDFIFQKERAP